MRWFAASLALAVMTGCTGGTWPDEDRVCSIDQSSFHFIKCWGKCPVEADNCYLKWRAKGSEDEWDTKNKDNRDRDAERDAELEYACFCS